MPLHDWSRVYSGLFHDFHQSWSIYLKNALNGGILPKGVTALVEHKTGTFEADVLAVDSWSRPRAADWEAPGGTATLERPATRILTKTDNHAYAAKANRIVVQQPLGQTIAVIEIVSPGNKDGRRAIKKFVEKSRAFIARNIHLLIVDPFGPTKRDPYGIHQLIWGEFDEDGPPYRFPPKKDRLAVSYRSDPDEMAAYVEPLAVGDALPDMPLFLAEHYHVMVPIEAAYLTAWSFFPEYHRQVVETGIIPGKNTADRPGRTVST